MIKDIPKNNARRYPNKTAIVFGDIRYTFKEFNDRINSLANALLDIGLRKGDWIAMIADNCHQIVEMLWAGAKIGVVTSALNSALSERDFFHLLGEGRARAVVFSPNYRNLIESLRPQLKSVKDYIVLGTQEGFKSYEEMVSSHPPLEPEAEISDDDLVGFASTSGTTGLSKQPMHTFKSIWATALMDLHAQDYDMREGGALLAAAPLFWGIMPARVSVPCFYMSCTLVIPADLSPQGLLQVIEKEKITNLCTGTAWLSPLIAYPELDKYDHSSLRHILIWGYLPPEVWQRAIELFGKVFVIAYGLSEKPAISYLLPEDFIFEGPSEKVKKVRSCGKEAISVEVRVVDDEGKDIKPGQIGEVIARGDDMMKGYWNAPKATEETIKGGYVYSGDLATVDEEGYIYLAGRKKDVITTQGRMVLPSEIEEVISQHPRVLEVAAIGIPDERLGEAIKAVIVKREGEITEEEIVSLCRKSLPDYAVPQSVDFVESLPKTPSGRIQRYKLRQRYSQPS